MNKAETKKAQYVMVGGFLGAGKTTSLLRFAHYLRDAGKSVGLITNDQSYGLVDTALAQFQGFDVEEITGGCFCCRFESLVDASRKLSEATRPDVFLAEPVGSCTDLRASVTFPLRRIYGEDFRVAPLSVLMDPIRASRVLGLREGKAFSSKVLYVYEKQLEEADFLVINKTELVSSEELSALDRALAERYPDAKRFQVSAREGTGLDDWFQAVLSSEPTANTAPDVDYDVYAEGEALLGWFNGTWDFESSEAIDGNTFLQQLGQRVRDACHEFGGEIGHLKMILAPSEMASDMAAIHVVRNDSALELSHRLQAPLESGELLVNLRVEGPPEKVREVCLQSLQAHLQEYPKLQAKQRHVESFSPARPNPTYRMAAR